jgi:protein TonB
MKHWSFWIALLASGFIHSLAFGLPMLYWILAVPPSSPPIALLAYGDSSIEGLRVDTVSLDPGTLRQGDEHTPGGEDGPMQQASEPNSTPSEPEETLPVRPPDEADSKSIELPPPEPEVVALPKPADEPATKRPAATEAATTAKTPGAPGGARLPQGTPSRGGTVGSSNGVRMIGLPKPSYPREAIVRGIQGEVMLFLRISAEGKVSEVKLHKSSGYPILDEAALSFGKTLTFIPARENYQPIDTTALFPVTYELASRR